MPELLLELRSEEIPARMQARAADDLRHLVSQKLGEAGLTFDHAFATSTPRRLVLVVEGLPLGQPDRTEEKKGPKLGAPQQAIDGFLKANGLASTDEAEVRETPKGEFFFAVRTIPGQATRAVLPALLAEAIRGLGWPKSMRWAETDFRWVRPLHAVLALFAGERLEGALDVGDRQLAFTDRTRGHPFLAPDEFQVDSWADYRLRLENAFVLVEREARRKAIVEQCSVAAHTAGLAVKDDTALVEEVTGLVEWPEVLTGSIDERFMALPDEVLSTSMRSHQKYFSLVRHDGKLAPKFLVVADMSAEAGSLRRTNIVAGNERVLRARLADAEFFWQQDRKHSLQSRVTALREIVFHARLGTVEDKVDRVTSLAVEIAKAVPGADVDRVRSAARLAKADLTTGMVGEFPELQGVMGRYYALADGEHADVAEAVAEHYAPQGPTDACPTAPASVCVALADKLDTLVGMFAIDEKPTGSKDPFALRRAALGVIRLIVENGLRLPLAPVFKEAHRAVYQLSRASGVRPEAETVAGELLAFFADRLKVALREQGVRHDLIQAVFALGGEDDLVRLLKRVEALDGFLKTDDGANLLVAYRRAANIVRIEAKKDGAPIQGAVEPGVLEQPEEQALFRALELAGDKAAAALDTEDFTGAMAALAELRRPVDAFFDRVTVNAEEARLRVNRLRLLARIGETLGQVADFSAIEGG
jgi:glycyl-tRNA synthetase beta chain